MRQYKKANVLVVVEAGQIKEFKLDDKLLWKIGRPSRDNVPDIKLHAVTVSRNHGKLQNMDGTWFYVDGNGKNGSYYNHKHIEMGIKGKIKPIMLKDKDVFVFGAGKEEVINYKTVWATFLEKDFEEEWRVIDTKDCEKLVFESSDKVSKRVKPSKGEIIDNVNGIAIYMGDLTYVIGDMSVSLDKS